MSFWFPTDYDEGYQGKSFWLRIGALLCSALGLILLAARHEHPFMILFGLPVAWSMVDSRLLVQGHILPSLVYVLVDSACALFFAWNIPKIVVVGVEHWSFITIVMALFYSAAVSLHGLIFLREATRTWEESRLFGRGNGVQLPT